MENASRDQQTLIPLPLEQLIWQDWHLVRRQGNVSSMDLQLMNFLSNTILGIWKNKEELMKLQEQIETRASTHFNEERDVGECRDFKKLLEESNDSSDGRIFAEYEKWLEAVGRCKHWRL